MQVPFELDGVLRYLRHLIETKGSAVLCVAEGAGQVTRLSCSIEIENLIPECEKKLC